MRREFFKQLYSLMRLNPNIIALTGDLGYGGFDRIKEDLPDQFINCGASEQAMTDMAIGLSYEGKIPVVYSITPFLLYRPFEALRTYINHEQVPVKLIGSGRDQDYLHDGYSHWAEDTRGILKQLPNIKQYYPETTEELIKDLPVIINSSDPIFLSLKR